MFQSKKRIISCCPQAQLNHISNITCNKRMLKTFILYASQNYQFLFVLFIFIRGFAFVLLTKLPSF